jgi:hypothetical protein
LGGTFFLLFLSPAFIINLSLLLLISPFSFPFSYICSVRFLVHFREPSCTLGFSPTFGRNGLGFAGVLYLLSPLLQTKILCFLSASAICLADTMQRGILL